MKRTNPKGYTAPLSPGGSEGIVPPPPWHYCGDLTIVEYRTNPDAVIGLLPTELEPADDPGAVAAIFADWQSCSDGYQELLDPIQSQYKEFIIVVGCKFQGKPASRCVYIWVDKDFAMYRGWIQGFPKKLASIHISRTYAVGKATPKLEPGSKFAGTCTAGSREVAHSVVTLRQVSKTGPTLHGPPMHNTRHFPALNGLKPAVFELVTGGAYDFASTEIWEGDGEITLGSNTIENLRAIAPKEILKGYRLTFAYSTKGGQVLAQHDPNG
jgi:acetoacetate decarboxylase